MGAADDGRRPQFTLGGGRDQDDAGTGEIDRFYTARAAPSRYEQGRCPGESYP
jgi:hypothetical protein